MVMTVTRGDGDFLQDAIDEASARGGATIYVGAGTFPPITLRKNVELVGEGPRSTIIRAPDGWNGDVVKSEDFDTLTGTNTWLEADGVPTGMALRSIGVDGNKANNTSGSGIRFYAKRYVLDNVIVDSCAEDGIYSECAYASGQPTVDDLPEAMIGPVWTRNNGRDGLRYFGPHDGHVSRLISDLNGTHGVYFGWSENVYNGTCDVGFIHTYANQIGLKTESRINAVSITTETNYQQAAILGGTRHNIVLLHAYANHRAHSASPPAPQSDVHVSVDGTDSVIGMLRVRADYGGKPYTIVSGSHIAQVTTVDENDQTTFSTGVSGPVT